jgi:lipoprotein-anchoring transpeptidase ErfK/SrfK
MKKVHIVIISGCIILGIVLGLSLISKNRKGRISAEPVSLKEAEEAFSKGDLSKARALYEKAMENTEDAEKLRKARQRIEEINLRIVLSPEMDECSVEYLVQPGDVLLKIAGKFNTTVNLIKRANKLTSSTIRPGQKLKVNTCKFSLVIDKSQNLLLLKRAGKVIKTYIVSTGKDNSTPAGTFYIDRNKLVNPTWYKTGAVIPPDSPENILGSRWMGLKGIDDGGVEIEGYGIHGTTTPDELGQQITLGCIRMKNEDVEVLFDLVPSGTEVVIID